MKKSFQKRILSIINIAKSNQNNILEKKKHLLLLRFPETILFSKTKVEWVELREKNDSLGSSKSRKSRKRC